MNIHSVVGVGSTISMALPCYRCRQSFTRGCIWNDVQFDLCSVDVYVYQRQQTVVTNERFLQFFLCTKIGNVFASQRGMSIITGSVRPLNDIIIHWNDKVGVTGESTYLRL